MSRSNWLSRFLIPMPAEPPRPVQPGLYHYMRSAGLDGYAAGAYTRFHLRVEADGWGMLLANASAVLHLSPSGVVIAKGILDNGSEEEIIEKLKATFRGANREAMQSDIDQVAAAIVALEAPGDNYPVMNLDDAAISPYETQLMAPFQADISFDAATEMNPILDKLWQANIPHVTFLITTESISEELVLAVERAEDLGMIAGVRGLASTLGQSDLLSRLALAGLDHCNVLFISADAARHDGLTRPGDYEMALNLFEQITAAEVAPVAEVPLLEPTLEDLKATLSLLLNRGISNVNFAAFAADNTMSPEEGSGSLPGTALPQMADVVEEMASSLAVRFIWQPPAQRNPRISLADQLQRGSRCTADVSIRVESNGDVLPPRGPHIVAGNLLRNAWDEIWADPVFVRYRERVERPTRCEECPGLTICAADCPREPRGWSQTAEDTNYANQ